jgi:hypothetical protein
MWSSRKPLPSAIAATAALLLLALVAPRTAAAQNAGDPATLCGLVSGQPRTTCAAVVQALTSAQPQLGILVAGGNPTLGTASTQGMRFGSRTRIGLSTQVNVILVRLPNILLQQGGAIADPNRELGLPAPAISGTMAVALLPGLDMSPGASGVGSVDLLGSATWLPFSAFDTEGFAQPGNPDFAYGVGAKVGLLRESFTLPGASVSVMYRRLGRIRFGDTCPGAEAPTGPFGVCAGAGDAGDFGFDLTNWSVRGAVTKRVVGVGLTAGGGYDRYSSELEFGFRFRDPIAPSVDRVARVSGIDLTGGRWSGFANASYNFLIATLAIEAGWAQGAEPVAGYEPSAGRYDPRDGTFFGSAGIRVSF